MKKDDSVILPQELLDYYVRIKADVLNFKRAMVRKYKGNYYHEKAIIKILPDGQIDCPKEYAPTDSEARAIAAALAKCNFPHTIEATLAGAEKYIKTELEGQAFMFASRLTGGIVMIQERRIKEDGDKFYVPHCYFSDGIWRMMEPDGRLPFWKPLVSRNIGRIMIHEGAKAANAIENLLASGSHPWFKELELYEHWGAIGGALAQHRCNYEEIYREKPTEVVYVADNDFPGKAALQSFSRHYGFSLKGIVFDERWPASWDMADPMPKSFFHGKRYNGPTLRSMMIPATWATEVVSKAGGGRPAYKLRSEFAEEWYHCITPDVYVHKLFLETILGVTEFNDKVRPFSDVDDVARLIKQEVAIKSMFLNYFPTEKPGMYMKFTGMNLNTHCPSLIVPEEGNVEPFLEFMNHLIPNDGDRYEMMRWAATLIARPDIKMLYGVLLVSEVQGVGKGTLGEKILAPIIGEHNVSFPSESDITESNFNYWCSHKRLAIVHEIYAGHSAKAYNRLKSIVTDKFVTVSKKYQANYEIENWVHIFACSNSMRAIQLSVDDRRWFVPKVTDIKKPEKYWQKFNAWLTEEGGLGIIRWWATGWLKDNPAVLRGEIAPWSEAKREMIEEGYSTGMLLTSKILNWLKEELPDQVIVIVDTDIVQVIKDQIYEGRHNDKLERPITIRKVAKAAGWYVGSQKITHHRWGKNRVNGRIITNSPDIAEADLASLRELPLDIRSLVQGWSM